MPRRKRVRPVVVRGTEITPTDARQQYREKIARVTLDSMVQFVGLLDAEGTVLEINQVALDAVGITLADVEGKPFWTTFWWQVSEGINATLRASIARAARGEFVRWDTAIYGRAGGRETIVIDASLMPVTDDSGAVVFICAEGRDITEKKAQEREIAQKNLELQGLLERIRELDEIKTQFFANVSHELRTPLALILGPAQRLIDDAGTMDPGQRQESGQLIARNARMLLKHVNDLLDMSKLEARKLKIELQEADVAALVRVLASHFAVLAADRRIDYLVEAGEPLVAAVDPDKLQRIVMNLLGNAFKFVSDGGRVRCTVTQRSGEIVIAVDDSGPGVKPELRQSIFERFRQGDGGVSRRVGGTGLGLAIAKEFVELHKGHIDVLESDLGGARFEVSIPMVHVAPEAAAPRAASPDPMLLDGVMEELQYERSARSREAVHRSTGASSEVAAATSASGPGETAPASGESPGDEGRSAGQRGSETRARVLVVEDNPDMNRFVSECLRRDYDVASAFDGADGLAKALTFRPALVVSDIMMPNVSGVEMIASMRRDPDLASLPVLLLSAKADEELMVRLLDEGAQDFIVKPCSERELRVRVRNLVLAQQAREATTRSLAREHEAREEVELQKRLLQSLVEQAPTLILVLRGPNHVIELANPPACAIFQRSAEQMRNRPLFDVLPGLRAQSFPALLDAVYRTGRAHVGKETAATFAREDGGTDTVYFNFIYSPFRDAEGNVEGIFVVASDVTEQVLSRQQVDSLREAAEEANRAKDEFLAMLGHELRNPLSPIMTALQLMKLRHEPGSERERTVIERQVSHLARLVDDLLDVARIARGRVDLKTELVEMGDIVAKAIEMASPLLEQRNHTLTVDVPRSGLLVDGDATRLSQVVSNLLTNAAKYTPPGGAISVHGRLHDDEVVLSVKDTGIGITADMLPRVFELFAQERQSLDRAQGGLGIGLSIVRSLVERHGGRVIARSEGHAQGSEFVVRLPAASRRTHETLLLSAPASRVGGELAAPVFARVLVVDDNEDGAVMLSEALVGKGYDTRVAHDAPTALRLAAEFMPDIAFLDLGLPVMDGYELASHLLALPGLSNLQLVAVTGYGQESDRRRTRDAGFHHHLVKPVDIEAVEATLLLRASRTVG